MAPDAISINAMEPGEAYNAQWRVLARLFRNQVPIDTALNEGANLTLVGPRLKDYYEGKQCGKIWLALLFLDQKSGLYDLFSPEDREAKRHVQWLLSCLQDREYKYDEDKCEATFKDSEGTEIVLNIWEWAKSDELTAVVNVQETLLGTQGTSYYTYLMYSEDFGDEKRNIPPYSVRRHVLQPEPGWKGSRGFRLYCNNYPYGGNPVNWGFIEWTGKRGVDGGETVVFEVLKEKGYDLN